MLRKPRVFVHKRNPGETLYYFHVALSNSLRHQISHEISDRIRSDFKPGVNSRQMVI